MRVLCVAEKPSAAIKLTEILSQHNFSRRATPDVHVKNYDFTYNLNGRPCAFVMTALKGHFMEQKYIGDINRNWNNYPIEECFDAEIHKSIPEQMSGIAENLRREIAQADVLFIWTDCDREGEAIGGDLMDYCMRYKPDLVTWRAHFSSMLPPAIHHAAQNHEELDMKQVNAVRARSELDLRIGAAFTRLQTKRLKSCFQMNDKKVLSYGSCQFPALGFVVDRYQEVENFLGEEFWKITLTHYQERDGDNPPYTTNFNWRRNHIFDRWLCMIFYHDCVQQSIAEVTKVNSKQTSKWKPLPLTTVELQKIACRVLNLSGHQIMEIAEGLYRAGLISYPRTETDRYDPQFDFMPLLEIQKQDSQWGDYARLLAEGEFERPRNGRNDDKAHPPIHPTAYNGSLSGNEKRVYEFIVRRFLGSCWKNAIGCEKSVEVKIAEEYFDVKGLVVLERNYLEIYTYDKWTDNEIPEFQEGYRFLPDTMLMVSGMTTAPKYLTEPDLIGLMEKNEIGTDATIAEHIQKILDRRYVYKEQQYFRPLTLGTALVLGYDQIGLEQSLNKPFLRRQMEADLRAICQGTISPDQVLSRSISMYREMFNQVEARFSTIRNSMDTYFREADDEGHSSNHGGDSGPHSGRGDRGRRGGSRGREAATRARGSNNNRSNNGNDDHHPHCGCNKRTTKRTVTKEGPNKGRPFYSCPSGRDQGCNFFEWADE